MKKRLLVFGLSMAFLLAFAGCGQKEEEREGELVWGSRAAAEGPGVFGEGTQAKGLQPEKVPENSRMPYFTSRETSGMITPIVTSKEHEQEGYCGQ